MNFVLVEQYINSQPIKVVPKFDLTTKKLEYDKIVQCQKRTDAKPEEIVRAFLLTRLVNELGYAPDRIDGFRIILRICEQEDRTPLQAALMLLFEMQMVMPLCLSK